MTPPRIFLPASRSEKMRLFQAFNPFLNAFSRSVPEFRCLGLLADRELLSKIRPSEAM